MMAQAVMYKNTTSNRAKTLVYTHHATQAVVLCSPPDLFRFRDCLFGLRTQEGDEVIPIFGLLETTEGHFGAWDIFLRVF